MLELRRRHESAWDEDLRPIGYGDHDPKPFAAWWARHHARLANISPEIAEQWIYRHWASSPFRFLRLGMLAHREETWSTPQVLSEVHLEFGGPLDAERDYQVFQAGPFGPLQTASTWRHGTWNRPILVLQTPAGIRSHDGEMPEIRYLLVEGSKRMRFLHALAQRGEQTGPHPVVVMTSSDVR